MSTLEQIDTARAVTLRAYQHDLDRPSMRFLKGIPALVLQGQDAGKFVAWAKREAWRATFEADLQSVAKDAVTGEPFLSTWVPLVIFREGFCAGGREIQDDITRALMERLRLETRGWRDLGTDTVDVSGYWLKS